MVKRLFPFSLLFLLLLACNESATVIAPSAFSSPLSGTAEAIALNRYATQAAAEAAAAQAAANATAQAAIYQATVQAAQVALEQRRLEATQTAAQATAQAQATVNSFALQMTAQAANLAATATQRSYEATATAVRWSYETTATAVQREYEATATRQARSERATATAESWQATRMSYQATATRAAEERELMMSYGRDFGLPLLLLSIVVVLIGLILYAVRQQSRRPVIYPRGLLGDAEPIAVPLNGGGMVIVDVDRQPGPAIVVRPDGTVAAPQLRKPGQEERTTARDQMVDAATRPRLGRPAGGQPPVLPLAPPPGPPGLRRVAVLRNLGQAGKAGMLPPDWVLGLEEDWNREEGDE